MRIYVQSTPKYNIVGGEGGVLEFFWLLRSPSKISKLLLSSFWAIYWLVREKKVNILLIVFLSHR